jgi:ribosome-binding protein aMBF1 (putative translation factor)
LAGATFSLEPCREAWRSAAQRITMGPMKPCQDCGEEVDELETVRIGRKKLTLCEECAEVRREEMEIAEEAEGAMQEMMEYKGR